MTTQAFLDLETSVQSFVDGLYVTSEQKLGLTGSTFLAYILPPLACQYLMGVLVQLEGTRYYRLALLPVVVWLTWRATYIDASGGDPRQAQVNTVLVAHMCTVGMRVTVWAAARRPFRRQHPSEKQDRTGSENIYTACWNAWDLMYSTRGIGWNWSRGPVIRKRTFETDSRLVFILISTVQVAFYALGFDACIQAIRALSPDTFGSIYGGSLFDHTLSPLLERLRAVLVSLLAAMLTYFGISWSYHFLAIVCVAVFQHHPSQWPPVFNAPWLSTSLTEFWGRRWHQMMREPFVGLGIDPFSYLFGKFGGLFAAFLISGIFHDIELRSFGRGGNSVAVISFWVVNSVGVGLERVWKYATGRRVSGVWGRMWMFGWLAFWGTTVVDEWAKTGRFGALSLPGGLEPSLALVGFVRGLM